MSSRKNRSPSSKLRGADVTQVWYDELDQAPDGVTDALSYMMQAKIAAEIGSEEEQIKAAMVAAGIPLPDPSWPIEQQKAHLALHVPPGFKVATTKSYGSMQMFGAMMANLPPTSPALLQKIKDAVAAIPPLQPLRFRRYFP